jgi:hypothetical protein
MKRDLLLWTGILGGAIAWLLSFEANFALAPLACVMQGKLALYVISLIALAVTAGCGLLAWKQWTMAGREWPGNGGGVLSRIRVMAIGGVLLSAMFFIVILAQAIPEVILAPCD